MADRKQPGLSFAIEAIEGGQSKMVGDGTIFARADANEEVVSVYEIDAEDGSQEELSIYGSLVWTDTFDSVLSKRGAPAAVPSD